LDTDEGGSSLTAFLSAIVKQEHCDYIEMRSSLPGSLQHEPSGLSPRSAFWHHSLDLTPSLTFLFDRFHKSCFQRKIRRAEKEGLVYSEGTDDSTLRSFYSLLTLTRRRHGVPPQPLTWFRNLRDCLADSLKIALASWKGRPVASMLTLRHKDTLVYKYG